MTVLFFQCHLQTKMARSQHFGDAGVPILMQAYPDEIGKLDFI